MMWNKQNRRGTLEGRQFSISEWTDAPTEEVTTYDASEATIDQPDTSNTSRGGEIMNIDSIYNAIKNDKKEEDISSKGHLFDSTTVHPDVDVHRDKALRKASMTSAHYPRHALKKLTRRTTEVSFTVPSSNSDSLDAPTTSNIWTRLLGGNDELWDKGDVYDEKDDDSEVIDQDSCVSALKSCSRTCYLETRHFFTTLARYPYIICISFAVFLLTFSGGMAAVRSEKGRHIQQMQNTADFVARDTAVWFANEFRRAMMPLYGIQQGVIHSGYFDTLNDEIGRYPQNVIEETIGTPMTKRNVTGICDDPNLKEKFQSIVEPINAENNLDGIVVSYRLFPNNVACLNEPSGESTKHFKLEDFPQGDENGSADMTWGLDAGHSENPFWKMVTKELFIEQRLSIFGPFTLPPLKEAFCGHLAIWTPFNPNNPFQNVMNVHGSEVAGAWGFIMNFLDWGKLLDRSNIYERFASRGLEFELYRLSGPAIDGADRALLARSTDADMLQSDNSIIVETESLHGTWANKVGYTHGWEPSWYPVAVAMIVLLSFLFAFLTASMLVERQLHRDLLYKVMPRRAIKKLQRGQTVLEKFNLVTIFFSDIVGFTSLAGQMRPLQVMAMLNELYTEFDKLVEKHKVYKVETIGDAFMVVGGAPDRVPAPLAAERVALFALDAVNLVKDFKTRNGDTVRIRAGIASGPVCAGVVGKSMPRYCFFGDTVNFASRMESTSVKMRIQIAELTYRLLQDSPNKAFEIEQRREGEKIGVEVKGKGHHITYWVNNAHKRGEFADPAHDIEAQFTPKKTLLANEEESSTDSATENPSVEGGEHVTCTSEEIYRGFAWEDWDVIGRANPMVHATEDRGIINARFTAILEHFLLLVIQERHFCSKLSLSVKIQLSKFVSAVAETYGDPGFHRLSHALHVTSSMNKLLSHSCDNGSALDNFSLVFAAFLHDAGHTGMTNKMLQDENHKLSQKYPPDVPIAERFAIEIACELLFQPEFEALCDAIMPDDISKLVFSKSILVTDIAKPSRVALSIQRYEAAYNDADSTPDLCPLVPHLSGIIAQFFEGKNDVKEEYPNEFRITTTGLQECVRREHFMLVSDVSHLFQCWENFVKWNFRLFKEIHTNFCRGLCTDPKEGWFEGQIGFLEKYAIPLAERSQIFFDREFSYSLVSLGRANLALWKELGIQASSIMEEGVRKCEEESKVLNQLYSLNER